ncbi:MAG: aminoacyl-tRNA deacylase [Candidatus Eiseniibacteriota bacterium]
MPINPKLLAHLSAAGARYKVFPHRLEFTSQEIAEASCVPGRDLLKLVVLRDAEGSYLAAALPACMKVELQHLGRALGRRALAPATEHELKLLFPDCAIGTAPPFGHLYGIAVVMDPCLLVDDTIYFQAGSHREVVSMNREEFLALARPQRAAECFHTARVSAHTPGRHESAAREHESAAREHENAAREREGAARERESAAREREGAAREHENARF